MVIADGVERMEGFDVVAENAVRVEEPVIAADKIIKLEEPDFNEQDIIVTHDEFDSALAGIDENIEIDGVKIWPYVVEVVKLTHKPHVRELYRKCTMLVLKENCSTLDSAISRRIAAQFKCHGVTASRLTNYARRVRRRLPSSPSTESVTVVDLDDEELNNRKEEYEEPLVKNENLEELRETPHHITLINGLFHHVPIDTSEGSNDLVLFNYFFAQFIQRTHEMFRVKVPNVDLNLLRYMVLQAFEGKRNIADIAGDHVEPLELRKVCNAVASILHMHRNQGNVSRETSICTIEFLKFCNKYCCVQ
ncbi:hypothetical protein GCK32_004459 [Trichostrongylus colubriformis]|uniref:Uncharacterized protein n=1 Tax=Trichostrongylus colubriformis TaxID=6319 RepID=A0AAN8ETE6_TRICO